MLILIKIIKNQATHKKQQANNYCIICLLFFLFLFVFLGLSSKQHKLTQYNHQYDLHPVNK